MAPRASVHAETDVDDGPRGHQREGAGDPDVQSHGERSAQMASDMAAATAVMTRSMANRCRPRRCACGGARAQGPLDARPIGGGHFRSTGSGRALYPSELGSPSTDHLRLVREHTRVSNQGLAFASSRRSVIVNLGGGQRRAGRFLAAKPASSHWRNRPAASEASRAPSNPSTAGFLLNVWDYRVVLVPDGGGAHAIVPDGADPMEVASSRSRNGPRHRPGRSPDHYHPGHGDFADRDVRNATPPLPA